MFILYVFKKNNFCHIRRVYNSPANFRYFNRIGINSILFLLTQSLVPNWPIRTYHKRYHINAHLYFHYPNRHDLPNWTFVYSTIEIGHRTLDPPASNRKSVLIPILKIRISTLPITYKCCYNGVRKLFICTFKDRNRLNMRRLWELVHWLDWLCYMVALVSKTLDITN